MHEIKPGHWHVQVCVGALKDDADRYLIQQRTEDKEHYPGMWEFPGGKVENDEGHVVEALAREWAEELDAEEVTVGQAQCAVFGIRLEENLTADVFMFEVVKTSKPPVPQEGQRIEWMLLSEIAKLPLCPSMKPFIARLEL